MSEEVRTLAQGMGSGVERPDAAGGELAERSEPERSDGEVRWAWLSEWRWKSSVGPVGGNHKLKATARDDSDQCTKSSFPQGRVGWKPDAYRSTERK